MASQSEFKALPPPPLRIDKRRNVPAPDQNNTSLPWPTPAAESSRLAEPSDMGSGSAAPSRNPSGRFRIRVPSFTKQARNIEASQRTASEHDTAPPQSENPQAHTISARPWQPRWAPKLKRTNPSESVTTYSPILDAPLPALPPALASPPPAVKLDDTGFGRPISTTGFLDLNASRFSFLDMRFKDDDSDSDSQESHGSPAFIKQLPTIQEPRTVPEVQVRPPMTTMSSDNSAAIEPATASSSLQAEPRRGLLTITPSPSPGQTGGSQSRKMSLPGSSPALASLISSFPSPLTRDDSSYAPPLPAHSLPARVSPANASSDSLGPTAMRKENSWDGGERWIVEEDKHIRASGVSQSTSLPYLDMDDDDDLELSAGTAAEQTSARTQAQLSSSSTAPLLSTSRPARNPPPRPAPNMALPELPDNTTTHAAVRRPSPTSSVPLDAQQSQARPAPDVLSRTAQKPLILPALRSSASIDRLAAMAPSSSSPLNADGTGLKPLTLSRSASTDELAKSLDIPRDTVKQMLDTTQHVWRNHLLGSSALLGEAEFTDKGDARLSRSSSSPLLSTMFASQGSSEDVSKGSVAKPPAGRSSNRTSMLGLPYISSSKPSFEHQSPGWAVSKSSTDARRSSALDLQAERAKHRRTFLGRGSEEGLAASYNFSRPIRRDPNGMDPGMAASASMPSLAAARDAPKPPALLQSPLLLKGESEATGFAQLAVEDDQEILADSGSEAHFVLPRAPLATTTVNGDDKQPIAVPTDRVAVMDKPVPAVPQQNNTPSPRLVRRNSDTVLNRFAPEFGKRAPGELHAWSVCIDEDGVPAIRPSPSAFHRPGCSLAGKTNATWQCGCRTSISNDAIVDTPARANGSVAQISTMPRQSSPGRNRSMSAGNALDSVRQAELWSQVERNKELIRRHEREIAGLQQQVVRISTEIASVGRPSFSSSIATPDLASAAIFPAPPTRAGADAGRRKPLPSFAPSESEKPPVPAKTTSTVPLPRANGSPLSELPNSTSAPVYPARTLRGRIASLSKINLAKDDDTVREPLPLNSGHLRMRSSSSTSSLNKVFRFPWSRSPDKENAFPQPTPFPLGQHYKAASTTSLRDKALPRPQMRSVDEQRPLPAPPVSDASSSSKDKRYPPSSRKYAYETLHGPAFHSSVGSRHLRGRSGSSKSSSFGTSIFSTNDSHEQHETSRFASFPRLIRRWDSISSRGTSTSVRNSAEVSTPANVASSGSMPALSAAAGKPMSSQPSELGTTTAAARRSKTPPPRRSSLLRKSLEGPPAPRRTPIPNEFLQAKETVMAPISEQSEMGSPASARQARTQVDLEMSPASVVGASPAGPARMSMSERYRLQGLTVPAPLALSSSLTSPMLGSASLEPDSATKVGGEGPPRSPISPRSAKMPLPVAFSHGALTVSRRPSLSGP